MTYYISRNYKSIFNAAGKAKTDCELVMRKKGFKNLGFKQSTIPNSAIGTLKNIFGITWALLRLPFKSVLCTQYPNNKFRTYIMFVAKLKRCQIVTIVHDVRALKGRTSNIKSELKTIADSDVIIVHNLAMKQWFIDNGLTIPIIELHIFDYLADKTPTQNTFRKVNDTYSIAYAGGLDYGKNGYLFDMDKLKNDAFNLKLYGVGFEKENLKVNSDTTIIEYLGAFKSDEIAYNINADFGLVWDGISTETCSGQYGEYLKYNNPHKTSLYLLAGLPIIVWDKAAISNFISNNQLGIAVSDLKDLNAILKSLSKDDYNSMKKNVISIQDDIRTGKFMENALQSALLTIR